jgi:putative membrane protein
LKVSVSLALVAGLFVAIGLVVWHGAGAVVAAALTVGYGIIAVAASHLLATALAAAGWRALLGPESSAGLGHVAVMRWIRESVNTLLPVAQLGGDIVGARLLIHAGFSGKAAGASVIADKTLEVFAQLFVAAAGLVLLLGNGERQVIIGVLTGLAVMLPLLVGFLLAQRWGLLRLIERLLVRIAGPKRAAAIDFRGLHEAAWTMYRHRARCGGALLLHAIAWASDGIEIWLILYFMGQPISPADAFALEALGQAVRSAAFAIPGALGAQEAGYMALAQAVGLPPQTGLALSLVKRARQLILGVPALLVWQWLEARNRGRGDIAGHDPPAADRGSCAFRDGR